MFIYYLNEKNTESRLFKSIDWVIFVNLLSYVYILLAVLLIGALLWATLTLKIRAKVNLVRLISGLLLSALAALSFYGLQLNLEARISSLFIMVAFLTFALWPKGLSHWGVITSLRSLKPYTLVTNVSLSLNKRQQTVAVFQFGTMHIVKMIFKEEPNVIYDFLVQHQVKSIERT